MPVPMPGAQRAWFPDGRLHLQHGPIDVVIGADGDDLAVAAAHAEAWSRFQHLLEHLVAELPLLRLPVVAGSPCRLQGATARAMWQAAEWVHDGRFLTPMAAVAGAVADTLAQAYQRDGVRRAWINDGGDIALVLPDGASASVGLYSNLARFDAAELRHGPTLDGRFVVHSSMPVRGVATSGWRGRSFSLGIADSVTVLASHAALADAAATMIANAVDATHPDIRRQPACELKDDTDLGDLPVTVDVPPLPVPLVDSALESGLACARALQVAGHVAGALLVCQGRARVLGLLDTGQSVDATLPAFRVAPGALTHVSAPRPAP